MFLSTGLRTDIVACYSDWLIRRIGEGFVYVRNPVFTHKISKYDLSPEALDGFVFRSRNYAPLLSHVGDISERYRTYYTYLLTGYGTDLEPSLPPPEERIRTLIALSSIVGREKISWRYDPILFTDRYTAEFHEATFAGIAERIAPYVNGCVLSFAELLVHLKKQLPELLPVSAEEKSALARRLAAVAERFGMPLRFCRASSSAPNGAGQGCVTLEDIATANKCAFRRVKHTGNGKGCACVPCRDIGWYNSCSLGCRYCDVNRNPAVLKENLAKHDPASPLLIGTLQTDDEIMFHAYEPMLKHDGRQMSLFDL